MIRHNLGCKFFDLVRGVISIKLTASSLINVLKAANQPVPEDLMKFGTTVKKKEHGAYGAFYKETDGAKIASKIKFD
jgi:ATP-dependent RNA helicase DBP3